jgi:hypothetical protein
MAKNENKNEKPAEPVKASDAPAPDAPAASSEPAKPDPAPASDGHLSSKPREAEFQLSPQDFSGLTLEQIENQIGFFKSKLARADDDTKPRIRALLIAYKNERGKRWAKLPGWVDGAVARPVPPWEADEAKARAEHAKAVKAPKPPSGSDRALAKAGVKPSVGGQNGQVAFKG